jgi:glycosyltransferase involved in cell wall biosynthesis
MRIGIYHSGKEHEVERNLAVGFLAQALANKHAIEIIRRPDSLSPEQLRLLCSRPLEDVGFRTVSSPPLQVADPGAPNQRYQVLRRWCDEVTGTYDLFVNFGEEVPIYCAAPRGVLVVQHAKNFMPNFYGAFWRQHLASYRLKLANSYYTRFWIRKFWGTDCPVLYPPVPLPPFTEQKENLIVLIQPLRLASATQKVLELIGIFKQLQDKLPTWSLAVVVFRDEEDPGKNWLQQACVQLSPAVQVLTNPTVEQQLALFQRCRLCWLANGTNAELAFHPEAAISFDVALLQAMGAGCVPLVNNSGFLSEVLRHGENGFFWQTTTELIDSSFYLANNEAASLAFTTAARKRANEFRPEVYLERFQKQLRSVFDGSRSHKPLAFWRRLMKAPEKFLHDLQEEV